ncbi:methyltransferase domain-containing protein [Halobacterium rubrum]|uniref:methyltransferase domain-containing protein n=1 Tax=Halobacterium TaxID=2239 RepID=UPI001F01D5DD|nr:MULTISPECIES: methyltransferase domain-containing protein [Halobacterium]MDH5021780.1 methyltransferase domain-containing protein [Halobacterium rubrum]
MTRPVPLFRAPELVTLIQPGPLTDDPGAHGDYLEQHIGGAVFIIGRDPGRVARLGAFAAASPAVDRVETCINDTGNDAQIRDHDLGIPAGETFDTIIYSKETTSWFGRSNDYQRLTPHLAPGGTLLTKSKWVPDSNRVRLDEIAVAGAFDFHHPEVYLRYTKTKTQSSLTDGAFGGVESAATGPGRDYAPRDQAVRVQGFESQFPEDARKTEFTPGWSWHSRLTDHVESELVDVDGTVANLCCGSSTLGDVRVDKLTQYQDDEETKETAATHRADATALPFDNDQFGAVVTDPPWKIAPDTRARLFSEAVRVVEPGGQVVQNSWWIPHHPYADLTSLRPVVANVTDDSLGGPGGLSFLSTFTVGQQPDLGEATYTLADHLDVVGVDRLDAYREWRHPQPTAQPALDPRFVAHPEYTCAHCGHRTLTPRNHERETPVYECTRCGYRNLAGEVEVEADDVQDAAADDRQSSPAASRPSGVP